MTGLFWGSAWAHRRVARDATAAAARSTSKTSEAQREVRDMEDQISRLTLICMAMWSLLKERGDLTEEDLMQRVKELDVEDGTADGKVSRQVVECPKCGRPMSPKHKRCMYCGAGRLSQNAFDELA